MNRRTWAAEMMLAVVIGLFALNSAADTFYISATATADDPGCEFGATPSQAWRSLAVQYAAGCIWPGDTVIFLAGTYPSVSPVFFPNHGGIQMTGTPGKPITLKAESVSGNAHPVRFTGEMSIARSAYLVIEGIEFTRGGVADTAPDATQYILWLGDVHDLRLNNVWVHGYYNDHCPNGAGCSASVLKDCVKIDGGAAHSDFVTIMNSTIHDCREDAVDITGRRGITLRNNEIYNARQMQIKGGAEAIVIDNNYIHHMRHGILSGGMDCTNDSIVGNSYCGSPEQVALPVEERFQARDVIIKNNTIESLELGPSVNVSGWQNAYIHDNRVINGSYSGGTLVEMRADYGWGVSAYFDDLALAYCSTSPTADLCVSSGTTPSDSNPNNDYYWRIRSKTRDVYLFRNSLHGRSASMLRMTTTAVEQNICMLANQYSSTAGGPPLFTVDTATLSDDALPVCGSSGAGRH